MRGITFLIAAWFCIGLDAGLSDAIQLGSYDVAPSFTIVLITFVCLWASHRSALLAALLTGIAIDLLTDVHTNSGSITVVLGPHALGLTLAAQMILTLRALIFRKANVITLALLTALAAMLLTLTVTATMSIRATLDPVIIFHRPLASLVPGLLSALYTGLLAIVLGFVLNTFRPLFAFRSPGTTFSTGGSATRRR